jgi:two-component system alkaline phosphatase synthesis response regulator PhoP
MEKDVQKKRVLIIDDDPVFVKLINADLHVAGYEVLTAEDGYKGIETAQKGRPDLIVMDIMMPGMDGHKTSELLKKSQLTADIPIIYITAKDGLLDEELAMEIGADFFLKKPYELDALLSLIDQSLQFKKKETDLIPKKQLAPET